MSSLSLENLSKPALETIASKPNEEKSTKIDQKVSWVANNLFTQWVFGGEASIKANPKKAWLFSAVLVFAVAATAVAVTAIASPAIAISIPLIGIITATHLLYAGAASGGLALILGLGSFYSHKKGPTLPTVPSEQSGKPTSISVSANLPKTPLPSTSSSSVSTFERQNTFNPSWEIAIVRQWANLPKTPLQSPSSSSSSSALKRNQVIIRLSRDQLAFIIDQSASTWDGTNSQASLNLFSLPVTPLQSPSSSSSSSALKRNQVIIRLSRAQLAFIVDQYLIFKSQPTAPIPSTSSSSLSSVPTEGTSWKLSPDDLSDRTTIFQSTKTIRPSTSSSSSSSALKVSLEESDIFDTRLLSDDNSVFTFLNTSMPDREYVVPSSNTLVNRREKPSDTSASPNLSELNASIEWNGQDPLNCTNF